MTRFIRDELPPRVQRSVTPGVFTLDVEGFLSLDLVYVSGGTFLMGSDEGDPDERPQHQRSIRPFYLSRVPITWRAFRIYCKIAGCVEPNAPGWGALDDHPVVNVSREDAAGFCRWTGTRLPYEEEWEYAARGTDQRAYPWGTSAPSTGRLVCRDFGAQSTGPVGACRDGASPFGALDMAGNVWEFCEDWHDSRAYSRYVAGDRSAAPMGQFYAIRGGSWWNPSLRCRTFVRGRGGREERVDRLGFRIALSCPNTNEDSMSPTESDKPKKKPLTEGEDPKIARQALDDAKRAAAEYRNKQAGADPGSTKGQST